MNRREFLKTGLGLAGGLLLPASFQAEAADLGFDLRSGVRSLDLYRPQTRERLKLDYLASGEWAPDAYARICWMLRDIQAQRYVRMDPQIIAILDWTQRYLASYGYTGPLHILSGYRTLETNHRTEGAARNSQHLYGRAVDIQVPGLSAEYLGQLMAWLSQGGVGVYERNGFVHVDRGQVRRWRGAVPRR